jgi:transposase-like protein
MASSRTFSREFKVAAVARIENGEKISALSRELKVGRKLLYEWHAALRAGGLEALRGRGRPRKGTVVVGARSLASLVRRKAPSGGDASMAAEDELAASRRRIAELERKVGQQALEADFFRHALRLFETSRRPSDRSGGNASTASSRPGRSGKAD